MAACGVAHFKTSFVISHFCHLLRFIICRKMESLNVEKRKTCRRQPLETTRKDPLCLSRYCSFLGWRLSLCSRRYAIRWSFNQSSWRRGQTTSVLHQLEHNDNVPNNDIAIFEHRRYHYIVVDWEFRHLKCFTLNVHLSIFLTGGPGSVGL